MALIALPIVFISILYVFVPAERLPPRDWPNKTVGMSRLGSVQMDSRTVVASLHQGHDDVFKPRIAETTDQGAVSFAFAPTLYPDIGSWTQDDHWTVANALNRFAWNDTLEAWQLFSIYFYTNCGEHFDGLGNSEFSFFKPKWEYGKLMYSWRGFFVYPELGGAIWAEGDFKHPFGSWKDVDLSQVLITAEDAFAIAVENGGSEYLIKNQKECSDGVDVWLLPQRWYGWRVYIAGFLVYVDPTSGEIIASFPPR